jgi:hypothetical protein
MTSSYFYLIIFAVVSYLIVTDQSIAKLIVLLSYLIKFQYEKWRWIISHHPKTPWARFAMWRRSNQLAKELMKEIEEKNR